MLQFFLFTVIMSLNAMESALKSLKDEEFSIGKASRAFGIPETTLRQYAQREGISIKAVSFWFFFCIRRVLICFRPRHIFWFVQATREYVSTKDNIPLQEAIGLVVSKGVPVNTASIIKKIPRTTLREALELLKKDSTKTLAPKAPKKARYEVDSALLADCVADKRNGEMLKNSMVKSEF